MPLSRHSLRKYFAFLDTVPGNPNAVLQIDESTPENFLVIQAFVDYSVGLASLIFEEYGS